MTDPMLVNVTYIKNKRIVRADPCSLCGGEGAIKTWAIGLHEGGQRTDYNIQTMCLPCREARAKQEEENMRSTTLADTRKKAAKTQPKPPPKPRQEAECAHCGERFEVPRLRRDRTRLDGGFVCNLCAVWRGVGETEERQT